MGAAFEDALRELNLVDRSDQLCDIVALKILGGMASATLPAFCELAVKDVRRKAAANPALTSGRAHCRMLPASHLRAAEQRPGGNRPPKPSRPVLFDLDNRKPE